MKNVLMFGGTGFIGRHLIDELKIDHSIVVLSRNPDKYAHLLSDNVRLEKTDYTRPDLLRPFFDEADAVINLAGENVGERWTKSKKQAIKNSRLATNALIVSAFEQCAKKPSAIIQGSGMGVYGFERSDEPVTEKSPLGTNGFLTEVGIAHEQALIPLKDRPRIIHLRTGLILDRNEGALPPMAMPFKFFGGGHFGDGRQWNSWIHIDDEVRAIRFLLENKKAIGPYNLTAPNPVRNTEFAKTLGKALHRPAFMNMPAFLIKAGMGEMADELLLKGLKVIPEKLINAGFQFKYAYLKDALADIYD